MVLHTSMLCTSGILAFYTVNPKISLPKGNLNKPTGTLANLTNNFTDKENKLKLPSCQYRDTEHFKMISKNFKMKTFFLFHMNVCSLSQF